MVQFLSIIFFLFLQFLLGFSKVPVFLCHCVHGLKTKKKNSLILTYFNYELISKKRMKVKNIALFVSARLIIKNNLT